MPSEAFATNDALVGCTRLAVIILGTILAPIAAGLALGAAAVVGGHVFLGLFYLPTGADASFVILFVLALIAFLLAGILFVVSIERLR